MSYKVIDNFLDKETFKNIENVFKSDNDFPWFYVNKIATTTQEEDNFYFSHIVYEENKINSDYWNALLPLINKIEKTYDVKSLVRIKCNCYIRTDKNLEDGWHKDFPFKHKGALFSINTNNGGTMIGKNKIDSVANRLLLFNPNEEHSSVSCTDEHRRLNINFNYF